MAEEEEDRLNFHSKFTRAKEAFPIDSLYTLIHGAKSTSSLELHIMTLAERKELLSRKASASPQPKRLKASAKPRQWLVQQVQEEERSNVQEVNEKLKKLRKMERDFHEEMDRREKQMRKRKQQRQQHKKEKQKYKPNLINVEDFKEPSPPRKQSSVPSRKQYSKDPEGSVPSNALDFQDYYRETPEVKINTAYEATPEVRKQIRQMIEMQKMREKEVQSVDEDDTGKAAASIVIERIDIRAQALAKKNQLNQAKKICEIELTHSRSQNTLGQYQFGKEEDYPTKSPEGEFHDRQVKGQYREEYPQSPPHNIGNYSPVDKVHFDSHHEDYLEVGGAGQGVVGANEPASYWVAPVSLAKQVQSIENIDPYQSEHKLVRQPDERQQQKIVQIEITQSQKYSEEEKDHHIVHHAKNRTGTEEGSELKQQIADKVEPIANRSEQFIYPNSAEQDNHVFHSQAYPHPNILPHKETKSIATDSLDFHPCEQQNLSGSGQRLQNKKSSFKKLMAENRANLVPRMAISTILNQKINQALGDIKNQPVQPSASPPTLQESIIKSEVSSPSTKRKVNFKRRIVEQQFDKSHSRDSKPTFERDPSRVNRNRKLLAGFFADN